MCKFEHYGDCFNCGFPQYMCKCKRDICNSEVPITNSDRIRSMSDEKLSEWILRNVDCGKEGVMCTKSANSCNGRCRKNRLDWLRQPAKEV